MIKTFNCKKTAALLDGYDVQNFRTFALQARRKLRMLDAAETLRDLQSPPSNHLEKLKGDRKDQYSIRINRQWRICFEWRTGNSYDVEIIDYH